jgi:hypothetical protein
VLVPVIENEAIVLADTSDEFADSDPLEDLAT